MADRLSTSKRSWNMSQIKGKDTTIELEVRKYLFHHGFRYRKNYKKLPGTPDIYIAKYNTVVFINGCFWHHHNCSLGYIPKSRQEYWLKKFQTNMNNDAKNSMELSRMGLRVLTIWECELKDCFEYRMECLVNEILNDDINEAEESFDEEY